jgi:hypothetical protein
LALAEATWDHQRCMAVAHAQAALQESDVFSATPCRKSCTWTPPPAPARDARILPATPRRTALRTTLILSTHATRQVRTRVATICQNEIISPHDLLCHLRHSVLL